MYYKILSLISFILFLSSTSNSQYQNKLGILDRGQPLPIVLTADSAIDTTCLRELSPIEGGEGVVPIFIVNPKTPAGLPKTNKPLKVILKGLVNSSGKVVKAIVLKSDNVILNKPALRALMQWELETSFEDTTKGIWVAVPFKFIRQ